MFRIGTFILTLAVVSAQSALGSTISYLGLDTTTNAGWRTTTTTKTASYDPDGDNVYGSDGYFVAYHGTAGGGYPADAMLKLPSYLSSVSSPRTSLTGANGTTKGTYYSSDYAAIDNPSLLSGSSVSDLAATGVFQGNPNSAASVEMFDISLASDATFVLALILGTHNDLTHEVNSVTITSSTGVTLTESVSTIAAKSAEYMFFTLSGAAGETFTISMTGNGNTPSCTGIAFEAATPEPSTNAMLISALAGLLAYGWRKRR
jgi:hypothetical protein